MTKSVRKADNLLIKHYPGFLLQENHYYPFGLLNKALSSDEQKGFHQRYGFNGKEFENGLDWRVNDFGARMYDPVLGRWDRPDSLSLQYANISPFVYVGDNPIGNIDPDGNEIVALNRAAEQTLEIAIDDFGGDKYSKLIKLDKREGGRYVAGSPFSFKQIRKAFQSELGLTGERLDNAISFYNYLSDGNRLELSVLFDGSAPFTLGTGDEGTTFVRGQGRTTNEEMIQFERYVEDKPDQISEAIGERGFMFLPYQSRTFESDSNHKGTLIIDGTGNSDRPGPVVNQLFKALKEVPE